jgi:hypothetical protein
MTQPFRRSRRLVPALIAGLLLAQGAPAGSPQRTQTASETAGGLHTVRFQTAQGEIAVHLPDDLAAGDRISGTVSYSPAGSSEKERASNLSTLRGKVVEVAGQPVPEGGGWVARIRAAPVRVRMREASGGRPVEVPIRVSDKAPEAPAGIGIPSYGQAGRSLPIPGPFGGDPAETRVLIGGETVPILAQSPRQTIVLAPENLAGPVPLRVEQGETTAEGEVRLLAVSLSADRVHLQRGERTTLRVEVRGLEGLTEPIPLTLTNESPSVVRLGEGDSQTVTLKPEDVPPSGVLRLERPVESLRTGDFAITTALPRPRYFTLPPRPVPIQDQGDACACEKLDLTPDPKQVKANFDANSKKLTVTLAYSLEMSCRGRRGKCKGQLQILGGEFGDWLVRLPAVNPPWQGKGTRITGEPSPPQLGTNGQPREIEGSCGGRQPSFKEAPKAVYDFDLTKLGMAGNFDAVIGKVSFQLKTWCGAQITERTVTLRVDTGLPAADNQPQGIDLGLSDLDGDGLEDVHCPCRALEVKLDKDKSKAELAPAGNRQVLTVKVPYAARMPCQNRKKEESCSGKAVLSAAPTLSWMNPAQEATPLPGFPPSLRPADVTCTGTCDGKPSEQTGTLTYTLFLFNSGQTQLSGTVTLTFDATQTCGMDAKQAFTIELDTSKPKPVVKIEEVKR